MERIHNEKRNSINLRQQLVFSRIRRTSRVYLGPGHRILRERVISYHRKPTTVRQRGFSRETLEATSTGQCNPYQQHKADQERWSP